jgi:hypothetical protein
MEMAPPPSFVFLGVLASDPPNAARAGETIVLERRSEFAFRNGKISRIYDFS